MSIDSRARRRQAGLTLVELIISMVIIGVGVVGILQVLTLTARHSADPQQRKQALAIAEGLMEEVRMARFTFCDPSDANAALATTAATGAAGCATTPEQPGPDAGEIRPYDNVNDYVAAFGTPQSYTTDAAGNAFTATVGAYQASVAVTQDGGLGPAGTQVPADAALRITVTVAYGNDAVVLEGYRTRYAPRALP
ncbi:MAG TPA: type IV pilus modification protein PilV [Noviherbaspirillum sp.]|jgi:MSHA pilin protein MshD|uniref:type IV pilus modification protein PilV n=1 Tax=Noviherbaspirillum sp. TaxID=1926288 RepID=UPI002F943922